MNKRLRGYSRRFILLHALTYWVVGMLCYQIQGYEEAMNTIELFKIYRPLESPLMAAVVFFGQIMRGGILALLLYPFYSTFMKKQRGWLLIFVLVWGLTVLGSIIFIPNLLQDITKMSLAEFINTIKIGVPEITIQMLLFSWLLFRWERRSNKKTSGENAF